MLEASLRESLSLGHQHIGTEHILLGIVDESPGLASEILTSHGFSPEIARAAVLREVGMPEHTLAVGEVARRPTGSSRPRTPAEHDAGDGRGLHAGTRARRTTPDLVGTHPEGGGCGPRQPGRAALASLGVSAERIEGALAATSTEGTTDETPEAAIARIASIQTVEGGVEITIADADLAKLLKGGTPELSGPLAQALDQLRTSLAREACKTQAAGGEHGGVKEGDEEHLPLELGPVSNGEYVPPPPSPVLREAARRARELIDRQSRRRGMSRRDFLRTSMAAAAVFVVLDACTSDDHTARTGRKPGGTLTLPEETTVDPDAATDALGGDEFVFDLQTHFLEYDLVDAGAATSAAGSRRRRAATPTARAASRSTTTSKRCSYAPTRDSRCVERDPRVRQRRSALDRRAWTTPRRTADHLCGDGRILHARPGLPALGDLDAQLDAMDALLEQYPIAAWKVYTHAPPPWFLDDHDPTRRQVGQAFLDRARERA